MKEISKNSNQFDVIEGEEGFSRERFEDKSRIVAKELVNNLNEVEIEFLRKIAKRTIGIFDANKLSNEDLMYELIINLYELEEEFLDFMEEIVKGEYRDIFSIKIWNSLRKKLVMAFGRVDDLMSEKPKLRVLSKLNIKNAERTHIVNFIYVEKNGEKVFAGDTGDHSHKSWLMEKYPGKKIISDYEGDNVFEEPGDLVAYGWAGRLQTINYVLSQVASEETKRRILNRYKEDEIFVADRIEPPFDIVKGDIIAAMALKGHTKNVLFTKPTRNKYIIRSEKKRAITVGDAIELRKSGTKSILLEEEDGKEVLVNISNDISKKASEYEKKRDFDDTPEPKGGEKPKGNKHRFVIQSHRALKAGHHYDLRLENDKGTMSSWAIPKHKLPSGKEKLLAKKTEDHPLEYRKFKGEIPRGEYGAGKVDIYDSGTYEEIEWGPKKIKFRLKGKKEKGTYILIKTNQNNWLLRTYQNNS